MRLLTYDTNDNLQITRDAPDSTIQPYAILSHTWGKDEEEVTFLEVGSSISQQKSGYTKIDFCGKQTRQDGWQHFWIDTCCIDRANHTELSKAITSMYRWYENAQVCYVYLVDVSLQQAPIGQDWRPAFRRSRWFTRGWTLQELLAPREVVFYSKEWERLGTRDGLKALLHDITGIPPAALEGRPLSEFTITERMRWTCGRQTKEKEDLAYCLLGIFGVYMYLNYGEGDHAFRRLQKELDIKLVAKPVRDYSFHEPVGLCLIAAPRIERDYFIGREHELEQMASILLTDEAVRDQYCLILGGMGGVGKTQLAIAYAQRYTQAQRYDSIFWLNATSKATLASDFQALTKRIFTPCDYREIDSEDFLDYAHAWLSHSRNTKWLLIFDNYDEPQTYDIRSFFPNTGHGSIIVTTRRPDLVAGKQISVRPMQKVDDSLRILQTRSRRSDIQGDTGANRLAERLAGLPLALATAGTFLRRSTWTFQQYLDAYEKQWTINTRASLVLAEYQDRTLYTTWELSYSRLQSEEPDAAQLLKLFAYFDHQVIWYDLLHAGTDTDLPEWLTHIVNDSADFEAIMGILVDYCFLEKQTTAQTYSMHACVHDWTIANLNRLLEPWSYWYTFHCVASSINSGDLTTLSYARYASLTPHAVNLTNARFTNIRQGLAEANVKDVELIAQLLQSQVQFGPANLLMDEMLSMKENALGVEHTSTLDTVYNFGRLHITQGKLAEAEQMYERALAGRQRALGQEHTSTLETVHSLGSLYYTQGKLAEADQMYSRALAGRERALGQEHSSTLETVHNLGNLYRNQGKLDEAEQMYLRALAGKEKVLGLEHTSTLLTVHSIGNLYRDRGQLCEAEQMYLRALVGRESALGQEHKSTLETIHNLGNIYRSQGKLAEAEQMYLRALAGKEKVLGPEHTSTILIVNHLGNLYRDQGELADAEQMYSRALARKEKALGVQHTSTLSTINDLGSLYYVHGKLEKAVQIYLRALAGYEKVLGLEHKSTLDAVNNLGNVYRDQGKLTEAKEMYERAQAGYKKILGPEHTSTLDSINNLGLLCTDQGKLTEAKDMYERALAGYEKALGPDHTSTLRTVNNLGIVYEKQGRLIEAERIYFRALAGREKALGMEHTSTLSTVGNLGNLYRGQGRLPEAKKMYERALAGYEKAFGSEHMLTLRTVNNLGLLDWDQKNLIAAEQRLVCAAIGSQKVLGSDHPATKKVLASLEKLSLVKASQIDDREQVR